MRRIKLTMAYDGTDYNGWQFQPGQPTIQGEVERVLAEIMKTRVVLKLPAALIPGCMRVGKRLRLRSTTECLVPIC